MVKKFDVILADPPWDLKYYNVETANLRGAGRRHYDVMSEEKIAALPVADLANENCILFMWAIWTLMPAALRVIASWGFEYRTCGFVWIKSKPSGFGFFTGMGAYTRRNTEFCLIGIKGSMRPVARDVSELIYTPVKEHSRKPDDQYTKIERLYPDVSYIELFARRKRCGWDAWGNEIESTIVLGE